MNKMSAINDKTHIITYIEKFSKLFSEPEDCDESEKKQKIKEINEIMEEMNEDELIQMLWNKNLGKINKMFEEKKMTTETVIMLLKHIECYETKKSMFKTRICNSYLKQKFEKMIIEEDKKKFEKDEKLLVDLCICYLILDDYFSSSELVPICVRYVLKVALKKEKNEMTQMEVEIALFALSNIGKYATVEKGLFLNEMIEIIQYHGEHRNLTHVAYHSAWNFLLERLNLDRKFKEAVANELNIASEIARELEVLTKEVDWKKKEEERSREEAFKVRLIFKWIEEARDYLSLCDFWKEDQELVHSLIGICKVAGENEPRLFNISFVPLTQIAHTFYLRIDGLLNGGAFDYIMEELFQWTLKRDAIENCLEVVCELFSSLKRMRYDIRLEVKREMIKRKLYDWLEEEGYEDAITSYHGMKKYAFMCIMPMIGQNASKYFIYL
ncbi:uncharacterized protein MONOS_17416 [Monocercomonoides exilis]|uniref:uncharacterized protein n=1 Tax=Monocercomonoides exilis TaxID=2049356 RepID=UPI003559A2B5|nr:hypothetical protein MONOS_17416 [Monocercomonoides exilis]